MHKKLTTNNKITCGNQVTKWYIIVKYSTWVLNTEMRKLELKSSDNFYQISYCKLMFLFYASFDNPKTNKQRKYFKGISIIGMNEICNILI